MGKIARFMETLAREMTILLIFIYKEFKLLAWNLYITEIMELVVRGKNHCTEDKRDCWIQII